MPDPDLTPLDTDEFDAFVEGLDLPLYVVTTADGDERSGCLVGFVTQSSLDPPRMLVCLSDQNHTYRVALRARVLAVHALDSDQHDLAELFGGETGDDVDKFARCEWRAGPDGVPLLAQCPRVLVGRILEHHPLGDHTGFLLEPVRVGAGGPGDELTEDDVSDVGPGHPA